VACSRVNFTLSLYIQYSLLQDCVSLNTVNRDVFGICETVASLAGGSII
jgi:hypothetical protein